MLIRVEPCSVSDSNIVNEKILVGKGDRLAIPKVY